MTRVPITSGDGHFGAKLTKEFDAATADGVSRSGVGRGIGNVPVLYARYRTGSLSGQARRKRRYDPSTQLTANIPNAFFPDSRGRLAAAGQMAERFFVEPAPENLYRVVFVGASTVQGFPHPRRLAAASFLESMLQDAMPDRTVEVFNLGITSIASFAVAQVVQDALPLGTGLGGRIHRTQRSSTGFMERRSRRAIMGWILSAATAYSAFGAERAGPIGEERDARYGPTEAHGGTRRGALDDMRRERAKSHLRNNLREIGQLCRKAGVPLVLCAGG